MALLVERSTSSESTVTSWAPLTPPPQTNTPRAPAETARCAQRVETRGRPRGTEGLSREKVIRFDISHGVDLLHDLANGEPPATWNWDGKAYPKTKRSQGPNQEGLAIHSEVLYHILTLAPNGYPCPYRLRDLLVKLHIVYRIFDHEKSVDAALSLESRAMLAADRWRIMCKHCLMLKHTSHQILFPDLAAVMSLLHGAAPEPKAITPEPAATASMDMDFLLEDDDAFSTPIKKLGFHAPPPSPTWPTESSIGRQ